MEPIFTRESVVNVMVTTQTIPGRGAVTCLQVTPSYIICTLDNHKIYVFNSDGSFRRILEGHTGMVWALAVQGDRLLSGGADNDIRVWDLGTGLVSISYAINDQTI